jgi:hypothetical protein
MIAPQPWSMHSPKPWIISSGSPDPVTRYSISTPFVRSVSAEAGCASDPQANSAHAIRTFVNAPSSSS